MRTTVKGSGRCRVAVATFSIKWKVLSPASCFYLFTIFNSLSPKFKNSKRSSIETIIRYIHRNSNMTRDDAHHRCHDGKCRHHPNDKKRRSFSNKEHYINRLLAAVNRERRHADPSMRKLELHALLNEAAKEHNHDQALIQECCTHTGKDGSKHSTRIKRAGYDAWYSAENVASGQHSVEEVMQAFMNSPGHKKNILNPEMRHCGFWVEWGGDGREYWTQLFANNNKDDWRAHSKKKKELCKKQETPSAGHVRAGHHGRKEICGKCGKKIRQRKHAEATR